MLKIKDDVDLKELEKFGFEKNLREMVKRWEGGTEEIIIDLNDKYIRIIKILNYAWCCIEEVLDVLFDLIQAGLIEKVEE